MEALRVGGEIDPHKEVEATMQRYIRHSELWRPNRKDTMG
jgi:hypothetical protein